MEKINIFISELNFFIIYIMFHKLLDFFKNNQVKNLYVLHKENPQKNGIYSLTHPILEPEAEITTFFDKPTAIGLSPEEQLSYKLTMGKKVNSFGSALLPEGQQKAKSTKETNKNSFGESFSIK